MTESQTAAPFFVIATKTSGKERHGCRVKGGAPCHRYGLGLGNKNLQHEQLQKWMFDWHTKLKSRLEAEIASLKKEEEKKSNKTPAFKVVCDSYTFSQLKGPRKNTSTSALSCPS